MGKHQFFMGGLAVVGILLAIVDSLRAKPLRTWLRYFSGNCPFRALVQASEGMRSDIPEPVAKEAQVPARNP